MARIPDEQIERLKQEVSLVRLAESHGYQPKRQGKDYVIRCPFHEDDTPSLVISPSNNLYHCFGCGAAGSVIDWTMKTQGLSFRHAVELLRSGDIRSVASQESAKPIKRNTTVKHPQPLAADPDQQGLVIRKAQWLGNGTAPELSTSTGDNPFSHAIPVKALEGSLSLVADLPEPTEASPLPKPPKSIDAEVSDQEVTLTLGDRRYRIRGLHKNLSYEQLKVNLLVSREDDVQGSTSVAGGRTPGATMAHIDSFDLYNARHRHTFINQAAGELGLHVDVIKKDLGKVLLKLEALQEKQIKQTLEPEEQKPVLNDEEQQAALALLKDKDLLKRILEDFHTAGVVGEETNKLMGYLGENRRVLRV